MTISKKNLLPFPTQTQNPVAPHGKKNGYSRNTGGYTEEVYDAQPCDGPAARDSIAYNGHPARFRTARATWSV